MVAPYTPAFYLVLKFNFNTVGAVQNLFWCSYFCFGICIKRNPNCL